MRLESRLKIPQRWNCGHNGQRDPCYKQINLARSPVNRYGPPPAREPVSLPLSTHFLFPITTTSSKFASGGDTFLLHPLPSARVPFYFSRACSIHLRTFRSCQLQSTSKKYNLSLSPRITEAYICLESMQTMRQKPSECFSDRYSSRKFRFWKHRYR